VPRVLDNFTGPASAAAQFRNTGYATKIRQVYGDSAAIDWADLGGPFDLIFIDGSHYYEYVKSDTRNALACLSAGGLVVWHDYGMIEDVSRAVDEVASDVSVVAIRGTRLAVGRPG
jgi:predicted O-methyltransferase YrrM